MAWKREVGSASRSLGMAWCVWSSDQRPWPWRGVCGQAISVPGHGVGWCVVKRSASLAMAWKREVGSARRSLGEAWCGCVCVVKRPSQRPSPWRGRERWVGQKVPGGGVVWVCVCGQATKPASFAMAWKREVGRSEGPWGRRGVCGQATKPASLAIAWKREVGSARRSLGEACSFTSPPSITTILKQPAWP